MPGLERPLVDTSEEKPCSLYSELVLLFLIYLSAIAPDAIVVAEET